MPKTVQNKDAKPAPKTTKKETKKVTKGNGSNKVDTKRPINVPIMRCVGQLKTHLNGETKTRLDELLDENKEYITTVNEFNRKIKECVIFSDKEKKVLDEDKTKEGKKLIRQELKEFRQKNEDLSNEFDNLNKRIYRISGSASKYLSAILHTIIYNILEHSIDSTIRRSTPNQKQPKVDKLSFGDISRENFEFYPIINDLPSLVEVQSIYNKKEKEDKDKDKDKDKDSVKEKKKKKKTEEEENDPKVDDKEENDPKVDDKDDKEENDDKEESAEDNDDKKKSITYKMVIYNIFRTIVKNRDLEEGKKLCCAVSTREVISDILLEYVERLSSFLEILVGDTAKANTINEDHIMNSNKLMFRIFNANENYAKFETQVQKTFHKVIDENKD